VVEGKLEFGNSEHGGSFFWKPCFGSTAYFTRIDALRVRRPVRLQSFAPV
jgi:hypothetical protein